MCTQHITPGIAVADGTDCLLTFTCVVIVNVTCTVCLINAKHWNITLMKFIAVTLCEYIIDVSSLSQSVGFLKIHVEVDASLYCIHLK